MTTVAIHRMGEAVGVNAGVDGSPIAKSGTEGVQGLLPDPTAASDGGDTAAMLATLLVAAGQQAKRTDRELQASEEKMQSAAEDKEIAAMHAKVGELRAQGWATGLASIAAGGLTVAAGANYVDHRGTSIVFEGLSKAADGGERIVDGQYKGAVADHDCEARQQEQIANRAKRRVDSAHDFQKDDADLIKAAIDFYRECSSAQSQARSAALHRS